MSQRTSELVIEKSVTVSVPAEEAFRVFTEGIGAWWPSERYSVDPENRQTVILEGWEGGRIIERTTTGEEHVWGTLQAWEPPHRFVSTWHPGRDAQTAQEVEVTFVSIGDATRVNLRHRGWENVVDDRDERMANYQEGWDFVLGRYAQASERS
jgi:uncharacterized protein YndB with AHSA1/START domain